MPLAGSARRDHARPLRLTGVVAAGTGLIMTLTAAAPAPGPGSQVTSYRGFLKSVSADARNDAWTVGITNAGSALALHWNGAGWKPVPVPQAPQSEIEGVSALSPSDAWVVGSGPGNPAANTLVLHWNGTAWARIPSPNPAGRGRGDSLTAVSALSPSDPWAVGVGAGTASPPSSSTIALHWNGKSWRTLPTPNPTAESALEGVSADSPSDAWAFGTYFSGNLEESFLLHWNGMSWKRVLSPNPGRTYTSLGAVSAVSPSDAWAAGSYFVGHQSKALMLHWDGTRWTQVSIPTPGVQSGLSGVSAASASDAWAAGGYDRTGGGGGNLMLHWNGIKWTRVPSPDLGVDTELDGVSAVTLSAAWAVGCLCNDGGTTPNHTLILRWNGTSWTRS